MRHRGPDWSGAIIFGKNNENAIAHERLAVVDPHTGNQPFVSQCVHENGKKFTSGVMVVANAEIYNHETLKSKALKHKHEFISQSDCEVIMHLVSPICFHSALKHVHKRKLYKSLAIISIVCPQALQCPVFKKELILGPKIKVFEQFLNLHFRDTKQI